MTQDAVSERVMIQANWRVAQPLLANILAMGRDSWIQADRELEQRKPTQHTPWRLDITGEMGQHRPPVRKKPQESMWMTWCERIVRQG
jgi:hypothetical protein